MALMLADGSSLVMSVVPKALLEMSRTQMRETFSNIMTKRVRLSPTPRALDPQPEASTRRLHPQPSAAQMLGPGQLQVDVGQR